MLVRTGLIVLLGALVLAGPSVAAGEDGRSERRPFRVAQREHGPISPSDWQAHRQSRIDARRGEGPSVDPRSPRRSYDGFDRSYDGFRRGYDTNRPESYEFRYRDRSPIGPAEIGRGYILQYDTRTHQHHPGCGHYQYDGDWHVFPRDHRHYDGCGHHFYDNSWHRWPRNHDHFPGCGHYYDDGGWFNYPRGHEHGPHCGHYQYDGLWHRFPQDHTHGPNCGHHYYEGDWYFWPKSHRHTPGCGHYYFNSLWFPYGPSYYGYEEAVAVYGGPEEDDYGSEIVDAYDGAAHDHAARAYEKSRNGDPYGAIAAFSTAIANTPDNGPLFLAQGLTYMQVGDVRSAYSKITEGLRRTGDLETGHPDLRGLIPDPEVIRWHIDQLTWTIESNPGNYRALFVLGYVHFLRGEYEEAKAALQDVAALDSDNESARRLLEFIYQKESGGNS